MKVRAFALMTLFYLVLPGAQVVDYIASQPFADAVDNLNFAASIVSYDWLLLTVLVGLKLPWFQRTFPYDWRIRVHVWTTVAVTALVGWHVVYYLAVKVKFIDLVSWSLLGLFAALVLLSLLWIPVPGAKALRERVLNLVKVGVLKSYDWLKTTHKVLFFGMAGLMYVHIVSVKLIGVASEWSSVAYQALFLLTAALFTWTRVRNLALPNLEVLSVATSGGIVRLALRPHPRLRYQAGQFAFLRFSHDGLRGEEHPFSFTSAPHESGVGFAMRALGDFTNKLVNLRPGDRVRVNGGFGSFRPRAGGEPLALIGSGIGAAPLVSLLKDLAHTQIDREVVCLLSVTRRAELLETTALRALVESMPRLRLRVFVFEEDGTLYGREVLQRELGDPRRYLYFLCSSEMVRGIVEKSLVQLGVPRRKVHFEAFNLG